MGFRKSERCYFSGNIRVSGPEHAFCETEMEMQSLIVKVSCFHPSSPSLLFPSPTTPPQSSALHLCALSPEEIALLLLTQGHRFRRMCARPCGCLTHRFALSEYRFHSETILSGELKRPVSHCEQRKIDLALKCTICVNMCQNAMVRFNVSTSVSFNSKASSAAAVSFSLQRKVFRRITKSPLRSQVKTSAARKPLVGRKRQSFLAWQTQ